MDSDAEFCHAEITLDINGRPVVLLCMSEPHDGDEHSASFEPWDGGDFVAVTWKPDMA
jgi:hypothetical protein